MTQPILNRSPTVTVHFSKSEANYITPPEVDEEVLDDQEDHEDQVRPFHSDTPRKIPNNDADME